MKLSKKSLTSFQWKVLKATLDIPFAQTRSYKWIAQRIGHPKAVRAVGQALRHNPYPLIIPCHRVIQESGKLGGYAGCYDGRKKRLLDLEKKISTSMKSK
jgi:methylated-DNA-[protein]-cysteine S-methyltransferase